MENKHSGFNKRFTAVCSCFNRFAEIFDNQQIFLYWKLLIWEKNYGKLFEKILKAFYWIENQLLTVLSVKPLSQIAFNRHDAIFTGRIYKNRTLNPIFSGPVDLDPYVDPTIPDSVRHRSTSNTLPSQEIQTAGDLPCTLYLVYI